MTERPASKKRPSRPRRSFAHVLVPLDLSRGNERALDTALGLAAQNGARVTLLHVIHRIEHVPAGELRGFYRGIERQARRKLAQAARPFADARVPVELAVLTGDPSVEIVRWAAADRVDLIVMSSHRVDSRRSAQRWGTTSYKVGILCRCPVLLVK
jgi:nucleotide-binding universal stress UspA family protein